MIQNAGVNRVLTAVAIAWVSVCAFDTAFVQAGTSRTFRLTVDVALQDIQDFQQIEVWVPVPSSNAAQDVVVVENSLPQGSYQKTCDRKFGNSMFHFSVEPTSENHAFQITYEIKRKEWQSDSSKTTTLSAEERQLYLQPSRLVPTTGRPLELLPDFASGTTVLQRARSLYECVGSHVVYDKSKPGYGNGDVLWVCDSRTGNCTDFHSLFISLARSQAIPARFEIGFPLPPERGSGKIGGYHCWAWFFEQQQGWTPVDISEADKHPELKEYYFGRLTENRVGFSVGRDIILEPPQAGPPLNYFVHPYIEADGKPLAEDHLYWEYGFEDQ